MVLEKVCMVIARNAMMDEAEANNLSEDTNLVEDLDMDSLDAVEVVMALEDAFDIVIPDEDAEKFRTVADIVAYIEQNI